MYVIGNSLVIVEVGLVLSSEPVRKGIESGSGWLISYVSVTNASWYAVAPGFSNLTESIPAVEPTAVPVKDASVTTGRYPSPNGMKWSFFCNSAESIVPVLAGVVFSESLTVGGTVKLIGFPPSGTTIDVIHPENTNHPVAVVLNPSVVLNEVVVISVSPINGSPSVITGFFPTSICPDASERVVFLLVGSIDTQKTVHLTAARAVVV